MWLGPLRSLSLQTPSFGWAPATNRLRRVSGWRTRTGRKCPYVSTTERPSCSRYPVTLPCSTSVISVYGARLSPSTLVTCPYRRLSMCPRRWKCSACCRRWVIQTSFPLHTRTHTDTHTHILWLMYSCSVTRDIAFNVMCCQNYLFETNYRDRLTNAF